MSRWPYRVGDSVRVGSIKQIGTVEECLSGDRYRVAVGSLKITCSGGDLSPSQGKPRTTFAIESPPTVTLTPKPPLSIDLHGKRVEEAIRLVEHWLDSAIAHELSNVRIIHGLGTGRLQSAIHDHLRSCKAVRHFRLNDGNPGETLVYL